jgi:three-Cys-motif partner protein
VGEWVEDKFYYFDRYLDATRKARAKYTQNGNAVYIDLFSGPGKCRIKKMKKEIPSGALRVYRLQEARFNKIILNDLSSNNVTAMKQRIKDADIKNGDANEVVTSIVKDLSSARYDKYHFAFLDPFNPKSLKFETVKQMARLKRLDIMINFPIGPIRRNYNQWQKTDGAILDDFLGTSDWRKRVLNAHETVFCNTLV